MTKFEPSTTPETGCELLLSVHGTHEGELTIEELEEIDDVMAKKEGGKNLTSRIDVSTTEAETKVLVKYIIQTSLSVSALTNKEDRLSHFTVLDDPFIFVGGEEVQYR
jgi:hypothetical protein